SELSRSILQAEALRLRMPDRLPLAVLPRAYRQILYPFAYREALLAESRRRRVDPYLLAAIVRAESRFDAESLSPAAARGLAQLVYPTARRIAAHVGLPKLDIDDLYRPRLSIGLGAVYLSELLRNFPGAPYAAVAAYNAGEPQALLWQHYCNSTEPEEYLTKVAFRETRSYLGRVLSNWEHYQALYRDQPAATPAAAVLPHLQ
ncbi:MAG TPA: transglycosylase SLT domain-containing protein, partial [Thermoanaerobaculia bacterium]